MEDFMQNVSTTRRPLGITIIAILLFIQAVIEIFAGIFVLIGTTLANPMAGLLIGWVPLALGIITFIVAWGLWTLKPWAYWVTLIVEIVYIVINLFSLGQTNHSVFGVIGGGLISIIIVIYLLVDGNVRRAFRTGI
jgi:uncharacterized membrane protein (DUF2068 family)